MARASSSLPSSPTAAISNAGHSASGAASVIDWTRGTIPSGKRAFVHPVIAAWWIPPQATLWVALPWGFPRIWRMDPDSQPDMECQTDAAHVPRLPFHEIEHPACRGFRVSKKYPFPPYCSCAPSHRGCSLKEYQGNREGAHGREI